MWCKSLTLEKFISFRMKWFFRSPFLSVSPILLLNLTRPQCYAYVIDVYTRPEIKSWPDVKFCAHAHCVLPRCCLNHTVQKDSREVLGTSFPFGPTSEILENIQYGGSSVVKTDSQRSRFIPREAWFRLLLTRFAFIVTFEELLVLYSTQSIYKCLIS